MGTYFLYRHSRLCADRPGKMDRQSILQGQEQYLEYRAYHPPYTRHPGHSVRDSVLLPSVRQKEDNQEDRPTFSGEQTKSSGVR